jgi:hypothetical protein
VRRRRRGHALHGGRDREKKGDANWKTVAKSGPDPRRCSASVGGPPAPEAATAWGGLHRPGGSACGLLCIAHRLRADPCRSSRRRRWDLRLGRTSTGAVGGGGGGIYPTAAEGPSSIHGAQSLIEVITAAVRASLA